MRLQEILDEAEALRVAVDSLDDVIHVAKLRAAQAMEGGFKRIAASWVLIVETLMEERTCAAARLNELTKPGILVIDRTG